MVDSTNDPINQDQIILNERRMNGQDAACNNIESVKIEISQENHGHLGEQVNKVSGSTDGRAAGHRKRPSQTQTGKKSTQNLLQVPDATELSKITDKQPYP